MKKIFIILLLLGLLSLTYSRLGTDEIRGRVKARQVVRIVGEVLYYDYGKRRGFFAPLDGDHRVYYEASCFEKFHKGEDFESRLIPLHHVEFIIGPKRTASECRITGGEKEFY